MATVEVLVRHDEHGTAVWEARNVDTFALKGDPAKTRKAIEKFLRSFAKAQDSWSATVLVAACSG